MKNEREREKKSTYTIGGMMSEPAQIGTLETKKREDTVMENCRKRGLSPSGDSPLFDKK